MNEVDLYDYDCEQGCSVLKACRDKLEAIKTWSNSLTYSMSPEEWVEKIGDLNDLLGLNDPSSGARSP